MRIATLCLATAIMSATPAGAQSWRSLDVARQLRDSATVNVRLHYASGRLGLRAGASPLLYQMQLRYNAERAEPLHAFDATSRTLQIGVRRRPVRETGDDNKPGELRVALAPSVPIDLTLDLGAVEADLDLSGLRVSRLKIESDASDAKIRFDTLNATRMSALEFDVGAASLRAEQLANANARDVRVNAGVGTVELDFGGRWTQDIDLTLDMALGAISIHVPSDVGIRVEMDKIIASFQHEGLVKRGDAYFSENWSSAPRKLRVRSNTKFGRVKIDRIGR